MHLGVFVLKHVLIAFMCAFVYIQMFGVCLDAGAVLGCEHMCLGLGPCGMSGDVKLDIYMIAVTGGCSSQCFECCAVADVITVKLDYGWPFSLNFASHTNGLFLFNVAWGLWVWWDGGSGENVHTTAFDDFFVDACDEEVDEGGRRETTIF